MCTSFGLFRMILAYKGQTDFLHSAGWPSSSRCLTSLSGRTPSSTGAPCRGWTTMRCESSPRRSRTSQSTRMTGRSAPNSACQRGLSSTRWRSWASKWWRRARTWPAWPNTTRESLYGRCIRRMMSGNQVQNDHVTLWWRRRPPQCLTHWWRS